MITMVDWLLSQDTPVSSTSHVREEPPPQESGGTDEGNNTLSDVHPDDPISSLHVWYLF